MTDADDGRRPRFRNEPRDLAEHVTRGKGRCTIPRTHDRLDECHHWWHEMGRVYHEPDPFRYTLGAFLLAARSVTFMLQAEKRIFPDFTWYETWQSSAKADPVLAWLNESRRLLTHAKPLSHQSWARFRCLFEQGDANYEPDEEDEDEIFINLNPFLCTHAYIRAGIVEDHGHEYQRHWESEDLPDQELLEVCATIYDRLADVVTLAHAHLGSRMATASMEEGDWKEVNAGASHHLPCMESTEPWRTIQTRVVDGQEVWDDDPKHL